MTRLTILLASTLLLCSCDRGPYPSDAERTRLVEWLNAGLPE